MTQPILEKSCLPSITFIFCDCQRGSLESTSLIYLPKHNVCKSDGWDNQNQRLVQALFTLQCLFTRSLRQFKSEHVYMDMRGPKSDKRTYTCHSLWSVSLFQLVGFDGLHTVYGLPTQGHTLGTGHHKTYGWPTRGTTLENQPSLISLTTYSHCFVNFHFVLPLKKARRNNYVIEISLQIMYKDILRFKM